MAKPGQIEFMRLRSLLLKDKVTAPEYLKGVIKSDVFDVLKNYMELGADELSVEIMAKDGGFGVLITANTRRLKQIGALPKEI